MSILEPLHQLDIPEPPEVVVEADGEIVGITEEGAKGLRRILAQNVVATNGKGSVVQQRLPAGHGGCLFNYLLLLASLYLFATLFGVAGHRALFHRLSEDQIVRQLTIEEEALFDPVLNWHVIRRNLGSSLFSKPIVVTASNGQVKVVPIPG